MSVNKLLPVSRRRVLALFASGVAFLAVPTLTSAQSLTPVKLQLGWIANVQYAGVWIGLEKGYFKDEGIDLEVTAGGPNAPNALVTVAAGDSDIGYTSWLPFLDAIAKGNDFVLLGAEFQTSPLGIISLDKKPILEPKDIVGSKILAQGPNEKTSIEATLALAGLANEWTMVPAGFSPEPLVAGDGDGYTAFQTNQTITLEKMGLVWDKDFYFRSFDELGFPSYGAVIFTSRKYLEENRPAVVAYLRGLMRALEENEADPEYAARLAVEKYGVDYGLDLAQQIRQNELQMPIIRPEPDFPVLSFDREKILGPMYEAARATGRTDLPDIDTVVDFSVVEEARSGL